MYYSLTICDVVAGVVMAAWVEVGSVAVAGQIMFCMILTKFGSCATLLSLKEAPVAEGIALSATIDTLAPMPIACTVAFVLKRA